MDENIELRYKKLALQLKDQIEVNEKLSKEIKNEKRKFLEKILDTYPHLLNEKDNIMELIDEKEEKKEIAKIPKKLKEPKIFNQIKYNNKIYYIDDKSIWDEKANLVGIYNGFLDNGEHDILLFEKEENSEIFSEGNIISNE